MQTSKVWTLFYLILLNDLLVHVNNKSESWTSGVPWLISFSILYLVFCRVPFCPSPQLGFPEWPSISRIQITISCLSRRRFPRKIWTLHWWSTLCLRKILYADWLMLCFDEPIMWQRGWDYASYLGAFRSHCCNWTWDQFSWEQVLPGEKGEHPLRYSMKGAWAGWAQKYTYKRYQT